MGVCIHNSRCCTGRASHGACAAPRRQCMLGCAQQTCRARRCATAGSGPHAQTCALLHNSDSSMRLDAQGAQRWCAQATVGDGRLAHHGACCKESLCCHHPCREPADCTCVALGSAKMPAPMVKPAMRPAEPSTVPGWYWKRLELSVDHLLEGAVSMSTSLNSSSTLSSNSLLRACGAEMLSSACCERARIDESAWRVLSARDAAACFA